MLVIPRWACPSWRWMIHHRDPFMRHLHSEGIAKLMGAPAGGAPPRGRRRAAARGGSLPQTMVARDWTMQHPARSRPSSPRGARACGTTTATRPRHARTWRPGSSRPSHPQSARRASQTPSRRPHRYFSSELQLHPRSGSSQRPDQEVPWRMPMDRPSKWGYVLLPLMSEWPFAMAPPRTLEVAPLRVYGRW